jgi:Bacterial regulatory proteins, luxR family
LKLLSQGQTNPQIAQNLLFSVSTVKAQVRSILAKLGVSDRTQAAVRAIESRLIISSIKERLQRGSRPLCKHFSTLRLAPSLVSTPPPSGRRLSALQPSGPGPSPRA